MNASAAERILRDISKKISTPIQSQGAIAILKDMRPLLTVINKTNANILSSKAAILVKTGEPAFDAVPVGYDEGFLDICKTEIQYFPLDAQYIRIPYTNISKVSFKISARKVEISIFDCPEGLISLVQANGSATTPPSYPWVVTLEFSNSSERVNTFEN
jgi:hypothetical protein